MDLFFPSVEIESYCGELWRILFYHMLFHLLSEILLVHKLIYDIAPMRILIGSNIAVRL